MNFKNMSVGELNDVIKKAQEEVNRKEDERYKELVNNLVSAWNLLYEEFPSTTLVVGTSDDRDIDLFNCFEGKLSANNFYRY